MIMHARLFRGGAMDFFQNNSSEVVALVAVVLGFALQHFFRLKARLNYSVGHSANILVEEPLLNPKGERVADRQIVKTASISVTNNGLLSAKGVEITFNWKPPIMNVTPARAFTHQTSDFNRYTLTFDSLAPGEWMTIDIMSINHDLPLMTCVRSENSTGRLVNMHLQRTFPWAVNFFLGATFILGCGTIAYFAATAVKSVIAYREAVAASMHIPLRKAEDRVVSRTDHAKASPK